MKKVFFILTILSFFVIGLNAQTKKDGTPDMRYKANKQAYSTPSTTTTTPSYSAPTTTTTTPSYSAPTTTTSRPVYSGSTHTTSHGGTYPGSTNSHHKNGTYSNPSSNNRYGVHKKKN